MITDRARPRRRTAWWSSLHRTTATCSSTSCRKGIPVLGIDPAANVAAAAEARGVPTLVEFFGVELARRLAAEGTRPTSCSANNVLAQVPDLNDFVGGVASLLAPGGTDDVRVPAPGAAARGRAVRHDLPRALLLLLARVDLGESSPRTGSTSSTSRSCRATAGSLRVYAAHASERTRAVAARLQSCWRGKTAEGLRDPEPVRAVRRESPGVEARAARAADRAPARRQAGRRLRRARQGQHAAQLLRHPHRLPRLHRRPEPVQARTVHTGHAHPDPAARADRRDAARTRS